MSLALLSLLALVLAILLSLVLRLNGGLLALLLALAVALLGGRPLREVAAGFPTQVLLTLIGLTLLFAVARHNGTLARMTGRAVVLCRGHAALVPVLFFVLAVGLGTMGAGNIGAVALLASPGMAAAAQVGVPPLLMAICIASGGNAAALSPLSPTGVVAAELLRRAGMPPVGWTLYVQCLLAHATAALVAYLVLGGPALLLRHRAQRERLAAVLATAEGPWRLAHWATVAVLLLLLLGVALLRADVGALALLGAVGLCACRLGDEEAALRDLPWGTIVLVCGMMTLVALLERSGGTALLAGWLGHAGGPIRMLLLVGLLTGLLSVWSSSVGVVLPAFLPLVPALAQRTGADPVALASAVCVGAHLVDVSPLSTLGALCLAHAPAQVDRTALYRHLLVWGLSMTLFGALYCGLVFGVLGQPR
ncbi:MAG: SLC13 family permease [Myxococcales bacterium]|nr:SLC13 family permease [Myxococcota bacterium]MDW8282755.1 SLC13 family permease [Myxococcales bacterium]